MRVGLTGEEPAAIITDVPGPRSRELAARLSVVESRNITAVSGEGPIFWAEAADAVVRDVDGNVYIDLTAGFGVANAGHGNPVVASAIAAQAARLPHALGDVHPADTKLRLLEELARITPAGLSVSILGSAGAEAVEAALKTAMLHTGRPGILAFERAYHGLTFGALAATARTDFRQPFSRQLFDGVRFAPFPARTGKPDLDSIAEAEALRTTAGILAEAERSDTPIGAILVEPVQGRGGIVVPTDGFLAALRDMCDGVHRVLIFDEIYTGCGRTGRWFASEHYAVTPDLMCVGKALTGSLPLSAAIGTPDVMSAWPPSGGEAIHTSTFLGNPVACAAAVAQISEIENRGLIERAARAGEHIRARTERWRASRPAVKDCRGLGLLQGVVMEGGEALRIANGALRNGVLVLAEGERAEVLAITPPAVITDAQLEFALDVLERLLPG